MDTSGHLLGIDFGTSNTVAVARWPDGRVRSLLFDGAPLLPSAVVLDERGALVAGREALHAARIRPECFEPNPKRRIDDGTVLLGEREIPVRDLIAAVFHRVVEEADRVLGARPEVVLTHPATWGPRRCQVLRDAATQAGLPAPVLAAEPVAAGSYFVRVHGARLPAGAVAVIYDLGAGTFDASVLRRTATGLDVLACEGLPDAGGLDVDAALVAFLGAVYGSRDGAVWQRLERPASTTDRRARRLLWDDVRSAKEALSRTSSSTVLIPLLDEDAPLGREQLERLARPILDRTIAATAHALREAGVRPGELASVFLVGGGSRMPLAATLLHTAFGVAPTVIEQPEIVVAEGALHADPAAVVADGSGGLPAAWAAGAPAAVRPAPPAMGTSPVSPPFTASAPVSPYVGSAPVTPMSPPGVGFTEPVQAPPPGPAPVSPPGTAPISPPPAGPVSPAVAAPVSPPVAAPVSPPVAAPRSDAPRSVPPQSASPPAAPDRDAPSGAPVRAILTGVGVLVGLLIVLATDAAPEAFTLGWDTMFTYPAVLLLPAQLLVVAVLGVRGQLADPVRDPIGSAGRFVALVMLGHGVGMGLGLSQYTGSWVETELGLAIAGGIGFTVGGVAMLTGALADRRHPPGGWHRYGVPLSLGLGSGMAVLVSQIEPFNPAFFLVFRSSDTPAVDFGRYLAFTAGATTVLMLATVAAALAARAPAVQALGSGPRRAVNLVAAVALVAAGVAVAGEAAELLA